MPALLAWLSPCACSELERAQPCPGAILPGASLSSPQPHPPQVGCAHGRSQDQDTDPPERPPPASRLSPQHLSSPDSSLQSKPHKGARLLRALPALQLCPSAAGPVPISSRPWQLRSPCPPHSCVPGGLVLRLYSSHQRPCDSRRGYPNPVAILSPRCHHLRCQPSLSPAGSRPCPRHGRHPQQGAHSGAGTQALQSKHCWLSQRHFCPWRTSSYSFPLRHRPTADPCSPPTASSQDWLVRSWTLRSPLTSPPPPGELARLLCAPTPTAAWTLHLVPETSPPQPICPKAGPRAPGPSMFPGTASLRPPSPPCLPPRHSGLSPTSSAADHCLPQPLLLLRAPAAPGLDTDKVNEAIPLRLILR